MASSLRCRCRGWIGSQLLIARGPRGAASVLVDLLRGDGGLGKKLHLAMTCVPSPFEGIYQLRRVEGLERRQLKVTPALYFYVVPVYKVDRVLFPLREIGDWIRHKPLECPPNVLFFIVVDSLPELPMLYMGVAGVLERERQGPMTESRKFPRFLVMKRGYPHFARMDLALHI